MYDAGELSMMITRFRSLPSRLRSCTPDEQQYADIHDHGYVSDPLPPSLSLHPIHTLQL